MARRRRRDDSLSEPLRDSPEFAGWLRHTMTREDFAALPEDDVEALRRFAVSRSYAAGSTLFRQGERPQAIFVVEEGEVELVYETRFDRLVIQIVGSGSSIGELPVFLETPYLFTAVARTDVSLLSLTLDTLRTLVELHPAICFRWLRLVARRLDRAHRRLVELAGKSAVEQVVHFLLNEAEERKRLTFDLAQRELASALGLSRQTVSRALGELRRQGIVDVGRRRIHILDLDALRAHVPRRLVE